MYVVILEPVHRDLGTVARTSMRSALSVPMTETTSDAVSAAGGRGEVDVRLPEVRPDMSPIVTVSAPPSAVRSSRSTRSMSMRMLA